MFHNWHCGEFPTFLIAGNSPYSCPMSKGPMSIGPVSMGPTAKCPIVRPLSYIVDSVQQNPTTTCDPLSSPVTSQYQLNGGLIHFLAKPLSDIFETFWIFCRLNIMRNGQIPQKCLTRIQHDVTRFSWLWANVLQLWANALQLDFYTKQVCQRRNNKRKRLLG